MPRLGDPTGVAPVSDASMVAETVTEGSVVGVAACVIDEAMTAAEATEAAAATGAEPVAAVYSM